MDDSQATCLEQIRALVVANRAVRFGGQRSQEVYEWVEKTLVRRRCDICQPGTALSAWLREAVAASWRCKSGYEVPVSSTPCLQDIGSAPASMCQAGQALYVQSAGQPPAIGSFED
jgi:hypothetical protein